MRLHHRPEIAMNMTPMIDVVFLLIIFFLVSSHLARQETQLELDLPQAASANEAIEDQRTRVTINVRADGQALLGGAPTPIDQLTRRLAHEQADSENGLEVRIRSDRTAEFASVEPILVACAKAGVWKVTFAVRGGSN